MCQNKSDSTRREELEGTHLDGLKSSQATRAAKRTHPEHQGEPRRPGRSRRSWRTRQNESVYTRNERVEKTHQVDLERSQTSQTTKRSYQVIPRTTKNVLEASGTSASTKRTHHVEETAWVAIWVNQRHQEVSRAFGTAKRLSTAPDTMGYVPAATGASAESKRTRRVEKSSQEAIWASRRRRETSRAIGAAGAMSKATG